MAKAKVKNITKLTPKKGERFITELRKSGIVTKAAKAERISRETAYTWRNTDEEFAKAWDGALEEATDSLEQEARRRAHDGTLEPIYHQGKKVGTVKKYSDTLLIFLLKAHRPERFRERFEHTGKNGAPIATMQIDYGSLSNEQLERITKGENPLSVLGSGTSKS